jgi:hypothetical protein
MIEREFGLNPVCFIFLDYFIPLVSSGDRIFKMEGGRKPGLSFFMPSIQSNIPIRLLG